MRPSSKWMCTGCSPVAGGDVVGERPFLGGALEHHVVDTVGVELQPVDQEAAADQREVPLERGVRHDRVRHRRRAPREAPACPAGTTARDSPRRSASARCRSAGPAPDRRPQRRRSARPVPSGTPSVPAGNAEKSMITSKRIATNTSSVRFVSVTGDSQEVRVDGDDRDRRLRAVRADEAQVPGLRRSGVEDAEAILAPAHRELRLDLAVDDPLVAARRAVADHLEHFVAAVRRRAEALVGEDQRDVRDAVVARQAQRARSRAARATDPCCRTRCTCRSGRDSCCSP